MRPFSLRSSTIRLGIFLSTLIIATIIVFQLAWLRKVYRFEEKEFDHSVVKAIRGLYEDLDVTTFNTETLGRLIERPKAQIYLARINLPVNIDTLSAYLAYELEDFDIFTTCELALYKADSTAYRWTGSLRSPATGKTGSKPVPFFKKNYNYIALYFPNRRKYIISQMNVWIISTVVLLIVLVLFGTSLFYFYRQKFVSQTQQDLIHSFAHEFKTPVAVISLAADVLKEDSIRDRPERLATYANIVDYQAKYLNQQVGTLLEFAYAESRRLPLKKEPVDMHQLIMEAVHHLGPSIQEKKAVISYALNATRSVLMADRNYLLIAITNLLDNAIKYSREPAITISTNNNEKEIMLAVKDNGIGIERTALKKIFRKFYRVKQADTYAAKGFGLGLAFTRIILDAHGGTIKVESVPGQGSVFEIKLTNAIANGR